MKRNRIVAIVLLALIVLWVVVQSLPKSTPKSNSAPSTTEVKLVEPPLFKVDSAMKFLRAQVDMGPRVPMSVGHNQCGDWIVAKCKSMGGEITEQITKVTSWEGNATPVRNIIAQWGKNKKSRVILAAHWDSRWVADKDPKKENQRKPIDGANDGASGVAVLLEIARIMQEKQPEVGVDLVFFDNEDQGAPEWSDLSPQESNKTWCLGSQYWANNPHNIDNVRFGILLDMVGGKNARFNMEGTSMAAAGDVMGWIWNQANRLGYGNLFVKEEIGGITDDHVFMNQAGVRSIDIIDMRPNTVTMGMGGFEFGHFHHTLSDNMDNIDPQVLEAVGKVVATALYNTK
ncbi:MAG: M28 family peptidase [Bacteroidetes bacterium]|nr:M28 family peptidase [Bacteroidota bacterium]